MYEFYDYSDYNLFTHHSYNSAYVEKVADRYSDLAVAQIIKEYTLQSIAEKIEHHMSHLYLFLYLQHVHIRHIRYLPQVLSLQQKLMCYFVNLDLQCYNNVPINTFRKENVAGEMNVN